MTSVVLTQELYLEAECPSYIFHVVRLGRLDRSKIDRNIVERTKGVKRVQREGQKKEKKRSKREIKGIVARLVPSTENYRLNGQLTRTIHNTRSFFIFPTFTESVCRLTIILASPRTVPINVPVINTCLRECRKRQERTIGQTNLFVHVQDDVPVVRQVTSSN